MRPTPEQLATLTRFERVSFTVADFFARPALTPLSAAWNSAFMGGLIYSCGGRRFNIQGLENLAPYGKNDSILLVANHRSFFDFFTITALCYWRTNLTKRIFFPVRQTFFYTHPAGPFVNAVMSGMRMFPPVMREKEKKPFNTYAVERCIEELNRTDIGTVLGIHPEGTRNKNPDPYSFLPAQPRRRPDRPRRDAGEGHPDLRARHGPEHRWRDEVEHARAEGAPGRRVLPARRSSSTTSGRRRT